MNDRKLPTTGARRLSHAARAFAAALFALSGLAACRTPEAPSEPSVREIHLVGAPLEGNRRPLLGEGQPLLHDVIDALEDAATDAKARGVFLRVGPLGGAYGRVSDLHAGLQAIRDAGKPVHCHFETADNAAYALLASSCDRLSITPAGSLDLVGVAAQLFYLAPLLDRIGVKAELLQVGRFKGAKDPFTESEMPEPVAENLGALLDGLQAGLVDAIAGGRSLEPDAVRQAIDQGPFDAGQARALGLVDDVLFADGAREAARKAAGVDPVERVRLRPEPEEVGLGDLLQALAGQTEEAPASGQRLVVAHLAGQIVDGEESDTSANVASGPFVEAMKRFRDDSGVRAVVLRIDSPGGSALASDRMWQAVRLLAAKKPVIVSIGDMAASGGYYVASAGTEIVADPSGIVGSIGVVGGKVVFGDLAERWGVRTVQLTRGEHAAWMSPLEPFSDGERRRFERLLERTYRRFLERIATGRDTTPEALEPAAEGRVFVASRALELGLVDALGTYADALDRARAAGGLGADSPVEQWPAERTLLEAIAKGLGGVDAQADSLDATALARRLAAEAGLPGDELAGLAAELLRGPHPIAMAGFALRVR